MRSAPPTPDDAIRFTPSTAVLSDGECRIALIDPDGEIGDQAARELALVLTTHLRGPSLLDVRGQLFVLLGAAAQVLAADAPDGARDEPRRRAALAVLAAATDDARRLLERGTPDEHA